MPKLIEDQDYYQENDRIIFTAAFHIKRGSCCGNGCRHCPYSPKHKKGNINIDDSRHTKREDPGNETKVLPT
jgi:biotin synthase-like enzyme